MLERNCAEIHLPCTRCLTRGRVNYLISQCPAGHWLCDYCDQDWHGDPEINPTDLCDDREIGRYITRPIAEAVAAGEIEP